MVRKIAKIIKFWWFFLLLWGSACSPPLSHGTRTIIDTDPQGTKVFFDDKYVGHSPLWLEFSNNDLKKIELVLEGYHSYQEYIRPGSRLFFTMDAYTNNVEIVFSHKPDVVYLDHKPLPPKKKITVPMRIGEHHLFAYTAGYPFIDKSFSINFSSSSLHFFFPLSRYANTLIVKSQPLQAQVFYKNFVLATTPHVFKNLSGGMLMINFKKKNFHEKTISVNLGKNQSRLFQVVLEPNFSTFDLYFKGIDPFSQVILNDTIHLQDQSLVFQVLSDLYRYTIVHPDFYTLYGHVQVENDVGVSLYQHAKIASYPRKLMESVHRKNISNAFWHGKHLYIYDDTNQKVFIYDQALNPRGNFAFENNVYRKDSSWIRQSSLPDFFLIDNKLIIRSGKIFQPSLANNVVGNPVYLIDNPSSTLRKKSIFVFDNHYHQIKILQKEENDYRLWDTVETIDYFHGQQQERYLLPLRFHQAIRIGDVLIFSDIVNHDVKQYNWVKKETGYFISPWEKTNFHPMALASYYDKVLVASEKGGKIFVYDHLGKFIHTIDLQNPSIKIRYIFIDQERLYVISVNNISVYYLR